MGSRMGNDVYKCTSTKVFLLLPVCHIAASRVIFLEASAPPPPKDPYTLI